jgi:hypothetical protein
MRLQYRLLWFGEPPAQVMWAYQEGGEVVISNFNTIQVCVVGRLEDLTVRDLPESLRQGPVRVGSVEAVVGSEAAVWEQLLNRIEMGLRGGVLTTAPVR